MTSKGQRNPCILAHVTSSAKAAKSQAIHLYCHGINGYILSGRKSQLTPKTKKKILATAQAIRNEAAVILTTN
jgi:hypothetical protein